MKKLHLLWIVALVSLLSMKPKPRKIVFVGDSITQFGLKEDGYLTLLKAQQLAKNKADAYEIIGEGISGNQAPDIYLRLEADVLAQQPDEVVLWVGINDVWHKNQNVGVRLSKFKAFYAAILKKLTQNNIKVWVVTPSTISEKWDGTDAFDPDLDEYSAAIREIAKDNWCEVIDFRKLFRAYEQAHNPDEAVKGILTLDGCHLNAQGNKFVAEEFSKALKL